MIEPIATSGSNAAPRILAGVAALSLTALALLTIATSFRNHFDPMGGTFGAGVAVIATLCWWFALRGHLGESRARMRFVAMGGLALGVIGFVAGFIGPIIITPDANQGPLLGIFFTGPLGFVLGVVISWVYSFNRTGGKRPSAPPRR